MSRYPYIFQEIYGISPGLTNVLWVAQIVGNLFTLPLIPLLYFWMKKEFQKVTAEGKILETGSVSLLLLLHDGRFNIPSSLALLDGLDLLCMPHPESSRYFTSANKRYSPT